MSMYCHLCGAEIPDGTGTCPECGVDLGTENDSSEPVTDAQTGGPGEIAGGTTGDATSAGDQGASNDRTGEPDRTRQQGDRYPRGGQQTAQGKPGGQAGQQPVDPGAGQRTNTDTQPPQAQGGPHGRKPAAAQPPGNQSPQGAAQGKQRGQPGAGQPAGGGRRGGGPAQGQPGGHGGGFDFGALIDRLPLVPAAVGGAVVGILVFGIGIVIGAVLPSLGSLSALDMGASMTMDLHFSMPEHLDPAQFSDFQEADPPLALLGVLYLLPMVLLYQASKLTVDFGWDNQVTTRDAAISGASVVLGYLPIMLIAAILVPEFYEEFSVVSALLMSGLVYPIVFGALGGLSASEFTPGQRRVGTLYGIVGFMAVFVGLFVSSYVFIDTGEMIELATPDRLFATITILAQTHSLSFEGVGENVNTMIPILLTVLIVGLMGFIRVWRSQGLRTPVEAATRAVTPAVAYTFLFGVLASVSLLFADPYVAEKLSTGFFVNMFARTLTAGPLENIGAYVMLVFKTLIVFPLIVGGTGGMLAWWIENRNRTRNRQEY